MTYENILDTTYQTPETEMLSMGVNMDDLVRITFLEQSARYLGVYVSSNQSDSFSDNEYWIN